MKLDKWLMLAYINKVVLVKSYHPPFFWLYIFNSKSEALDIIKVYFRVVVLISKHIECVLYKDFLLGKLEEIVLTHVRNGS